MSESPRRILQVIGDFEQGGDGRVARNLASALREDSIHSACVALRSASLGSQPYRDDSAMGIGKGLIALVSGAARLRALLKRSRPEVVHVHGPSSLVFVASVAATLPRRPRIWFTWHDSGSVEGARNSTFRWAASGCEYLFGSSDDVSRRLSAVLGGAKVEVFRNGIPPLPESRAIDAESPTLVWAARVVPDKDPMSLLRATQALRSEGLRFRTVLAGGGSERYAWLAMELADFVAQHALAETVSMPGWLSDLAALWSSGTIGVQTSRTEGLSMTLLEQAMSGLAIVATDVGDTSAIIENEVTGLLIDPGDEEALRVALRRLISDPELRIRLGAAARTRAMSEFGLPELARQVRSRL